MPDMKFSEVKHNLALKFAERGIVLPNRKLKEVASIFAERVSRSVAGLEDMDQYVLDYADPTGELAVRNVLGGLHRRLNGTAPLDTTARHLAAVPA